MYVSASVEVQGKTAGEVISILSEVPPNAEVSLYVDYPDRPGESGTEQIKLSWDTSSDPRTRIPNTTWNGER